MKQARDLQRRHAIPTALNAVLAALLGGFQLFVLVGPQVWARSGWSTAAVVLAFTLSVYAIWALVHESIHGLLHPHRDVNRRMGRALAVVHGCPFAVVRVAHLLHHRYNRIEDFGETYDATKSTWAKAAVRHYLMILVGRYLSEVLINLIVWLPARVRARVVPAFISGPNYGAQLAASMANPRTLSEARLDALLALALWSASAWAFRDAWALFAAVHLIRAFIISVLDDAYHYGTPVNAPHDPDPAKNLAFGPSWLVLHFNHHAVHHANPVIPWRSLPQVARAQSAVFSEHYVTAIARQFAGPIAQHALPVNPPPTTLR